MNVTAWEEHWLIRKPGYGSREGVAKGVCGGGTFKGRLVLVPY